MARYSYYLAIGYHHEVMFHKVLCLESAWQLYRNNELGAY
jgi:hypothetical protein